MSTRQGGPAGTTPTTSAFHTFLTSNLAGPTCVNNTVSPSFSLLAVQKPAQPFVKEQVVYLPNVCVAVFTVHGDNGPCRVYEMPSNPSTPWVRQNAIGTSCAHPNHVLTTLPCEHSCFSTNQQELPVTNTLKFEIEWRQYRQLGFEFTILLESPAHALESWSAVASVR